MEEKDRIKKSFDFAADVTKQLIALSTAIISLCLAFTDKIFSSNAAQSNSVFLLIALTLFALSIISGIGTLMAMTGQLGNPNIENENEEEGKEERKEKETISNRSPIYEKGVRCFSIVQIIFFVIAIGFSVFYIWKISSTLSVDRFSQKKPETYLKIIRVSEFSLERDQVTDTLYLDLSSNQSE